MELISSFPPFTQQLYGLVMTSDNHLLTMTRCGNGKALQMNPSLLKYTFRGHLVAVIPLQLPLLIKSKLRFMALSGNSLYISDLGASYVYWVDATTGKLVDVIAGPGEKPGCFTEPSGIACDSNGNILIGDSRSNRIQIFDGESREYKGVLECSQKTIVRPSAICLQGDDKLIAVNYISHSVSFYSIIVETSHLSK
ncbi:tripartite motif-containing protein 2-like [Watersipora subatra]|uniref:tripartite motif-containing protein 2-like n=1 Tax=Watersipora subatra TaxID=2589382 RepID=UPI00355BE888